MVGEVEPRAPSTEEVGTAPKKPSLYPGLLAVLLLFSLVLGLWLFPPSLVIFEPHYLLPLFNSTLFLAAGVIAFIAWRSFLISGAFTILWLGCGVLTLGVGALAAGWLIYPFGPNANVTIFNVAVLLSAICHAGGVLSTLEEKSGEADPGRRRRQATLGYLAVLSAIALLVGLTLAGLMPPFFIQGKGPTVLRQYVVEWALVLLAFTSLVIMQRFLRKKAPFLYWYSLALALVAISMLAFLLQPAVGSPIGWVGRSSYVLAAVYFLLSVNSALQAARERGVGLSETLAELFGQGLHWQEILASVSDAVVAHDDLGKVLLWNQAAERIFGFPEAEVKGKGIDLILPDLRGLAASDPPGRITEIEPTRQDGSRFNAEISVSAKRSAMGVMTTLVIRDITERKRAEEQVKRQREEMQIILDSVPAMIFYKDKENRFVLVNREMANLTGLPREEIEGKTAFQVYPSQAEDYWQDDLEVMTTGNPKRDIIERMEGAGELKWMRTDKIPYRDDQGNIIGVIGFSVDITERKRAEGALRESEERLRRLGDNLPQSAVYQYTHEAGGSVRFLYISAGIEQLNGVRVQDVLHDAGALHRQILPEYYERLVEAEARSARELSDFDMEVRMRRADGQVRWMQLHSRPRRMPDGRTIWDGVQTDVTARKRAEEALRESEARFRSLFEHMTEGVALHELLYDEQGQAVDYRIVSTNPAFERHTGLKPAQIQGQLASRAYGTGEAPYLEEFAGVAQTGRAYAFETFFPPMQRYFQISVTSPKRGQFVTVFEDITYRKQAEEALHQLNDELEERVKERTQELQETVAQLEEEMTDRQQAELEVKKLNEGLEQRVKERTTELEFANRELEAFAYSVSHDLKSPLRAIQGFSRMLLGERASGLDGEGLRMLNVIVDNTRIMARLIDDLLALSRLGRPQMRRSCIDLSAMARQVFERLREQEPERDLHFTVPDLPQAWGDPSLINQVMMNLLGNAIKYTKTKKTATIEAGGYVQDHETVYYLKDNGVGFDERYASKLFGVFERLHSAQEYEGTGVGLAIVQRIIHRHGGRVWAAGQVGQGATFYFTLPKNPDGS